MRKIFHRITDLMSIYCTYWLLSALTRLLQRGTWSPWSSGSGRHPSLPSTGDAAGKTLQKKRGKELSFIWLAVVVSRLVP